MTPSPNLDATFAALADPTRRAIVERLALGEASVQELAAPFDISLPAISRHLKVLERAGLIARGKDAQRRPCRLRASALHDVSAWVEHSIPFADDLLPRIAGAATYAVREREEVLDGYDRTGTVVEVLDRGRRAARAG